MSTYRFFHENQFFLTSVASKRNWILKQEEEGDASGSRWIWDQCFLVLKLYCSESGDTRQHMCDRWSALCGCWA